MSVEDWIIGIVLLIPVLLGAVAGGDETPAFPSKRALRRHAWEKMIREEEREGVRETRGTSQREGPRVGPEPQAKWSDRR